ncbi:hypothetical protein AGMMS50229_01790 [Campylobacterota bacterium]|nr:hypothetical protein AGMMS50229_01790 [Campylobacterota bacterium]
MKTLLLSREGFIPSLIALFVFVVVAALECTILACVAAAVLLYTLWFFRNLERIPAESDSLALIAPIDGKISDISPSADGTAITIKTGLFDAHLIRSPLQTNRIERSIRNGICGALHGNDHLRQIETVAILNANGGEVVVLLKPTIAPSRFYKFKNSLFLGERVGFFYGGEGVVTIAAGADIRVAVGSIVKAGESVLGFTRS